MDVTGKHYTWFQNKECEYFPCHKGVREEEFNCLFCYWVLSRFMRKNVCKTRLNEVCWQ